MKATATVVTGATTATATVAIGAGMTATAAAAIGGGTTGTLAMCMGTAVIAADVRLITVA